MPDVSSTAPDSLITAAVQSPDIGKNTQNSTGSVTALIPEKPPTNVQGAFFMILLKTLQMF